MTIPPTPADDRWWNRVLTILLIVAGLAISGLPYLSAGRPTQTELVLTAGLIVLGAYLADAPQVGPFITGILDRIKLPWTRG